MAPTPSSTPHDHSSKRNKVTWFGQFQCFKEMSKNGLSRARANLVCEFLSDNLNAKSMKSPSNDQSQSRRSEVISYCDILIAHRIGILIQHIYTERPHATRVRVFINLLKRLFCTVIIHSKATSPASQEIGLSRENQLYNMTMRMTCCWTASRWFHRLAASWGKCCCHLQSSSTAMEGTFAMRKECQYENDHNGEVKRYGKEESHELNGAKFHPTSLIRNSTKRTRRNIEDKYSL